MDGVKRIYPERLTMVHNYPNEKSSYIVVRMVVEVDTELLIEALEGEEYKPLTVKELTKVMEREMEQIKETKYGNCTKLPDWFKAVDCAEIEESNNG